MYTVLLRATSLSGTLILYPFDMKPATGGMQTDLLREFRELELLADITRCEFDGSLPFTTAGHTRSHVISRYQQWKGVYYIPKEVHPAL